MSVNESNVSIDDLTTFKGCLLDAPLLATFDLTGFGFKDTIKLEWGSVTGADFYVVQIDTASDFRGALLFGRRVDASDPTELILTLNKDIFLGIEYNWRVIAYSNDGCASEHSEVRKFKLLFPGGGAKSEEEEKEEEEGKEETGDDCDRFKIRMAGPTTAKAGNTITITSSWSKPDSISVATFFNLKTFIGTSSGKVRKIAQDKRKVVIKIDELAEDGSFVVEFCIKETSRGPNEDPNCCNSRVVEVVSSDAQEPFYPGPFKLSIDKDDNTKFFVGENRGESGYDGDDRITIGLDTIDKSATPEAFLLYKTQQRMSHLRLIHLSL